MAVNLIYKSLPTVALRGLVVFPGMKLHFEVGREKSIAAIRAAMNENQRVFLVAQRSVADDDPGEDALFRTGVIASIKQVVKAPDSDNVRVLIEGECRADVMRVLYGDYYLVSDVKQRKDIAVKGVEPDYISALVNKTKDIFDEFAELTNKQARDVAMEIFLTRDPSHLADVIAANALSNYEDRQAILEEFHPIRRLEKLCAILSHEIAIFRIEDDIEGKVQSQLDDIQRENYLREQMRAISSELGEGDDTVAEAQQYREKILAVHFEKDVEEKLLRECGADLVFFSPIHDREVPRADGLLLGGGYPELFARALADNESMKADIRRCAAAGMPILAECGGFMYLQERLEIPGEKPEYEMCGVLPGTCRMKDRLVRFGYLELSGKAGTVGYLSDGHRIRGHEFHYYDSTDHGAACTAQKPGTTRSWDCMAIKGSIMAGFPHLYYRSDPDFARAFVERCRRFAALTGER